jgi:hypothetical protein
MPSFYGAIKSSGKVNSISLYRSLSPASDLYNREKMQIFKMHEIFYLENMEVYFILCDAAGKYLV